MHKPNQEVSQQNAAESFCCIGIVTQAAHDAGKEAGFKFSATEELQDLFLVHADSVASFHETRV
jgi:hypothetical protein